LEPQEQRRLLKHIYKTAYFLRLYNWRFKLTTDDSKGSDNYASIKVVWEHRYAHIFLGEHWATATAIDQTVTILHELFHCYYEPLLDLVKDTFKKDYRDKWKTAFNPMESFAEYACEQLAWAMVKHAPKWVPLVEE